MLPENSGVLLDLLGCAVVQVTPRTLGIPSLRKGAEGTQGDSLGVGGVTFLPWLPGSLSDSPLPPSGCLVYSCVSWG